MTKERPWKFAYLIFLLLLLFLLCCFEIFFFLEIQSRWGQGLSATSSMWC